MPVKTKIFFVRRSGSKALDVFLKAFDVLKKAFDKLLRTSRAFFLNDIGASETKLLMI